MSQKPININLQGVVGFTVQDAAKKLGNVSLPVKEARLNENYVHQAPNATLEVDTAAAFEFSSFRALSEEDPDGILFLLKDDDAPIPAAWMKYQLKGEVKASAGATLGALGFKTAAGRTWILSDYRKHDKDLTFGNVLTQDLHNFRTVLDLDDIGNLEPQEAVALEVKGELCASAQFAWSDVLCSELSALTKCLPAGKLAALRLSAGVTLQGKVTFKDDYLLVFARLERERFRVAVKKAKSREVDASLDVGLNAEIDNLDLAVQAIMDSLFAGRYSEVKDLLAAANPSNLSSDQQALLNWVCGQLKLSGPLATFTNLLGIVSQVVSSVETMARSKLTIGFLYEYNRIEEDKTLLQVVVPIEFIQRHHESLVRGDITSAVIEASEPHLPGQLENYLHEHSVVRTQCFGFTLGLGKWKALGKWRPVMKEIWRENIHRQKTLAFQGIGEYRTRGPGVLVCPTWVIDLKAETKVYAQQPLLAKNFEYGLHLLFQWPFTAGLREWEIEEYLDSGSLWRAFGANLISDARQSFLKSMGKPGQCSIQMRFSDLAVRELLSQLAGKEEIDFAGPLAAALPWVSMYLGRRDMVVRRGIYTNSWARFLDNPCMPLDQIARGAERDIQAAAKKWTDRKLRSNLEDLAVQEGYYPSHLAHSLVNVITANCFEDERMCRTLGTLENIRDLLSAVRDLNGAIQNGQGDYKVIEGSYRRMVPFWTESPLHARALGVLLMDIMTSNSGFPMEDVEVSLAFQEGRSEEGPFSESIVMGSKLS